MDFPKDIFTEPDIDPDTLANLGPLRPLAGVWEGMKGLYNWGPPPPMSFLSPDDLAELMAGAHA